MEDSNDRCSDANFPSAFTNDRRRDKTIVLVCKLIVIRCRQARDGEHSRTFIHKVERALRASRKRREQ